jgi:hypothetical protein
MQIIQHELDRAGSHIKSSQSHGEQSMQEDNEQSFHPVERDKQAKII